MPPWRATAAPGFPTLRDDSRLTNRQVATIAAWVNIDMPSGDLARMPLPPIFPTGWALGIPDLTLSLPRTLPIPADSSDRHFNVVLHVNLPDDRWITAIDYRPSTRGVLHHALFFAAPASLVVDDEDALPGFSGLLGTGRLDNIGDQMVSADRSLDSLGAWVPGGLRRFLPEAAAQRLPKRSNVIMQLHVRASDAGAIEDGRVAIYFARQPPKHAVAALQVPPAFGLVAGINIPAGEPRYVVKDSFTLPVDVQAIGARGYAHSVGREMKMTARLPNGSTRGLLWIERWDFDWQDSYYFVAPIRLPKGTVIQAEIVYDNSPANARNPSSPPRLVAWGPRVADEMGSMTLLVATNDDTSASALASARSAHFRELLVRPVRR